MDAPLTFKDLEDHIDKRVSARLDAHAAKEQRDRGEVMEEIKQLIISAFPNGDADGHRRFHEESIETMKDVRELVKRVRNSTITGLVWAVIVLLGASVWMYLRNKLGVGP